jgi:hypothetical protein
MKSAAVLVLLTLAPVWASPAVAQSAAPVPAAPPKLELAYTQFTLPNGLTVILRGSQRPRHFHQHAVPRGFGASVGRTGFAHLFGT